MILPIGLTLKAFNRQGQNKGFTLIEIILVILVLSVIIGMVLVNFSQTYKQIQLKTSANGLTYLMRYANSRAITQNKTVRLEFNADFSAYQLKELVGDQFVVISNQLGRPVEIPEAIKVESALPAINFFPDGSIDQQKIYLCQKEQCWTVSTKERRGHVQVFKERIE